VRDEAARQIVFADNALRTSLAVHSASQALQTAAQTTFEAASAADRSGVGSVATTDAYSTAPSAAATVALATLATGVLG